MTKLKIKENVGKGNPVDANYPFDNIEAGDMFYCYDVDWLVMVVQSEHEKYSLIELASGEVIPGEEREYFEDIFDRLTIENGEWYPVSKTSIKFTVGE